MSSRSRSAASRHLLLDLSGVICVMDHPARLRALASMCTADESELHEAVWVSGLDADFDRGKWDAAGVLEVFRTRFGFTGEMADFERAWLAGFVPEEALLAVIDTLRPEVGCSILSDNGPVLLHALPRLMPQLWRRFDSVFFSCDIGALKPDAATFRHAITSLDCRADEILFFDDLAENVDAARRLGMNAEVYQDAEQVRAVLIQSGLSHG